MCFGNTRDALEFLSVPGGFSGSPEPNQLCGPSTSRFLSKTSSAMLPTIDEDEELTLCGSPTSSTTSSCSCRFEMAVPDRNFACGFQQCGQQWQHQQCTDMMQMGTDQPEMEELLLAAIDMRLAQLLELRDQRIAALRARPAPAPTAADACCNGAGAGWAAPAPMGYAEQDVPPIASDRQASSGAARLAAAKVLQLQQMQCMQLALQRELLEVLGQSC